MAELYDRHAARILGLAIRIVRKSSDAEERRPGSVFNRPGGPRQLSAARGTVAGWLLRWPAPGPSIGFDRVKTRRDSGDAQMDGLPADVVPVSEQLIARPAGARACARR